MRLHHPSVLNIAALLLLCLSIATAHGHDSKGSTAFAPSNSSETHGLPSEGPKLEAISYFAYGEHTGSMLGHVVSMTIAWFFVLPMGKLL